MTGRMFSFEVNRTSTADAETLFRLETDAERWPTWCRPLVLQAGWADRTDPPGDVGSIRRVGLWPVLMFEKTIEYEPNRRHVYTFAHNAPVNDYRAEVIFTPNHTGGTDLCWRGSFTERLPGTGPAARALLRTAVLFLAARLVRAAEKS
ncbi:SRPBCC family protein [Amycolatopsis taiwanensis]|uniref:SRPBCC family protein n=1 Tax=Amycolatopsis taiwanensis TaxID=342230 RepID=UPI0004834BDE|nr:SRPBCC family protein [Amycolatopsis taiwanensis]